MTRLLAAFVLGTVTAIALTDLLSSDKTNRNYGFREDIDDLLDNVEDLLSLP